MTAALSNSVPWLKNIAASPVDIMANCLASSSATSSNNKACDSPSPHTLLLAQVHATLKALQVNNTNACRSRLLSNEIAEPSYSALEQIASKNFTDLQRIDAAHTAVNRDSSGLVIPAMDYYTAAHCNNVMFRHPAVRLPVGSHIFNEGDGHRNVFTGVMQPLVTGAQTSNVMKQRWHDSQTVADPQLMCQTSTAEQFYYYPLPTPMPTICVSSSKLNRSVESTTWKIAICIFHIQFK
jgi:hypothetical protein